MKHRKVVADPVQDGPVKAKPGDIESQEKGGGPAPVDIPPPGSKVPIDGTVQVQAKLHP